jgi:NDP-sugar pyrophosphorylase family protein
MQALILAGGEGKRMRQVTARVPKPLLYLPGGTLLEHQLALLAESPVTHTFVITRHRRQEIRGALNGLKDVTEIEQRPPFTLLGALASAEGCIAEPCVVLHGDNYFSHGLGYLIREAQLALQGGISKGVFLAETWDDQIPAHERLASAGCYALGPDVFSRCRDLDDADELCILTRTLLASGARVDQVPLRGWRVNINTLDDLLRVVRQQLEQWQDVFRTATAHAGYNRLADCAEAVPPVWVSPEAEVTDCRLGPSTVIGPRSMVRNCVLRNAIVFPDAVVHNRRVESGVVLPRGAVVLSPQRDVQRGQDGPAKQE